MIQVLGLRDFIDTRTKKKRKREVFFTKGWRFQTVDDVFNGTVLDSVLSGVPEEERYNLYFTVADCFEESGRKLKEQWVIPFDVDDIYIDENAPLESAHQVAVAMAEALDVPFDEVASVFSGNGVQMFIKLTNPIVDEAFFDQARVQYGVILQRIATKLAEKGLKGKPDPSVWSSGRLMRLPNTENRKPEKTPRQATILNGTMVARDFDLFTISGVTELPQHEYVSDIVLKNYPIPDTKAVCEGCKFLQWCKDKPNEVSEPQWYAMVSITSRLDDGRELTHAYSEGHKDYNHYETENKIDQALAASGPRTCKNIESLWDGCSKCAHYEKITSPIMLKGEDYIASADFGFRKRSLKNGKVIPGPVEYIDLVKQFSHEHPYKLVKDSDQIIVYEKTHWKYLLDRELKVWAMDKIRPTPSSAEMSEFVQQLKSFNVTSIDELNNRKQGFMNFSNVVLDVRTLETFPHSPEYGFFQVLPFAYDKNATAPRFEQFMLEISLHDTTKAETIKEYLGYCISGDECWLQRAMLLVGDGANGKSVLMETIGDLVGSESHSAVPLQDLEKETMRHSLVNKLFNYSEETSMRAMSESSLFKALVSGGVMTVKQLYVQPYMVKNRAKLLLSSNHLPHTKDDSHGLLRRLALVKMEARFSPGEPGHDYFIKDKLRDELPGICNSLIQAYARLKRRGVLLGERMLNEALEEYKVETSTIEHYLKHEVERTNNDADEVPVLELYDAYVQFCGRHGLHPLNNIVVGRTLSKKGVKSYPTRRNGKAVRLYQGIKIEREF